MRDGQCSKCGRTMEKGFIVDGRRNGAMQSRWTLGDAARGFFASFKIQRAASQPVVTFRCTGCGFLESYAQPDQQ